MTLQCRRILDCEIRQGNLELSYIIKHAQTLAFELQRVASVVQDLTMVIKIIWSSLHTYLFAFIRPHQSLKGPFNFISPTILLSQRIPGHRLIAMIHVSQQFRFHTIHDFEAICYHCTSFQIYAPHNTGCAKFELTSCTFIKRTILLGGKATSRRKK